jgi:hypothetical protein
MKFDFQHATIKSDKEGHPTVKIWRPGDFNSDFAFSRKFKILGLGKIHPKLEKYQIGVTFFFENVTYLLVFHLTLFES